MSDILQSMGSWTWPIWLIFGFFVFLILFKYWFLGWVTKRQMPRPLENWDKSASDLKGPRIVGADTQRVLKRSVGDVLKVVLALAFFIGCVFAIVFLGAEDLAAGRFKAWLGLICGCALVLAAPFLIWIVLTKYQFDDAKIVRIRPFGLAKSVQDWGQVADVKPLQKGSFTAGVKVIFTDKTVFRIAGNFAGYREFLEKLGEKNKTAAAMFTMSKLTKHAIDMKQKRK